MDISVENIKIEITRGDITNQDDISAIVSAANAQLMTGGGVAGAIHRAAGPLLEEACQPLAPIKPGQAVITEAFNLPNQYVIHTLGPVYGKDQPEDKLLSECYLNSLRIAEENDIESVAFPAISTGAFGYPIEEAATTTIKAIKSVTGSMKKVRLIKIVLFGAKDHEVFTRKLTEIFET